MRLRAWVVAPLMVGAFAANGLMGAQSASAVSSCPPNPGVGTTIHGSLLVTGTCTLDHVKVEGTVTVQSGATLITKTATISGNLLANGARKLTLSGGEIDGSLIVNGTAGQGQQSYICDLTVKGNVSVTAVGNNDEVDFGDDGQTCPATGEETGNTVYGSVSVSKNGSFNKPVKEVELEVDLNTINGNLNVDNNNNATMDVAGNTIVGNFSCAGGTNSDGSPNIPKNDEQNNVVTGHRTCFPTPNP